jgi:hypothetical protein
VVEVEVVEVPVLDPLEVVVEFLLVKVLVSIMVQPHPSVQYKKLMPQIITLHNFVSLF